MYFSWEQRTINIDQVLYYMWLICVEISCNRPKSKPLRCSVRLSLLDEMARLVDTQIDDFMVKKVVSNSINIILCDDIEWEFGPVVL